MPTFTLSTITLDFDTSSPPMKPATGVSGFSVTVNGSSRSITSVYRALEYRFAIILSSPMVNGDTVRLSYSGGNITDSASIGGSMDQPIDEFSNVLVTYNPFGVDMPPIDGTEPEEPDDSGLDPAQIFVDAPNGDFRLIVGSIPINIGTNVGFPYTGFAPDLGAIEFPDDTFDSGPLPDSGSSVPITVITSSDTLNLSISEFVTLLALVEKTAVDTLNISITDLASGYDLITQVDKTASGILNMTVSGVSNQQLMSNYAYGTRYGFMANFDYAFKRQTAKIVWGGVESGDPYVGPAVRIKEGSTAESFTGYVAVYVPSTKHVQLRRYRDESLAGPGTIMRDLDLTVPVASGIYPDTVPLFPNGLLVSGELMLEASPLYEEQYENPDYAMGSIRIMIDDYLLIHDIYGKEPEANAGEEPYLPISNGGVGIVACGTPSGDDTALILSFTGGEKSSETRMIRGSNPFVFCGDPITWQSFDKQDLFLGHRYIPEEFRIRSRLENEACYGFQAVKTWDYKRDACSTEESTLPSIPMELIHDADLNCITAVFSSNLEVIGGVGPFTWSTTQGEIVSTGERTAQLLIDAEATTDDDVIDLNTVAYYIVHIDYVWFQYENQSGCIDLDSSRPDVSDITINVVLQPVRCDGTTNLAWSNTIAFWQAQLGREGVIGVHDMLLDYVGSELCNSVGGPGDFTDVGDIWLVGNNKCCPDGIDDQPRLTYSAYPAGELGVNGIIWSQAPNFSDVYSGFELYTVEPEELITDRVIDRGVIDVRTQEIVDARCSPCAAIQGTTIIVTVTDSLDNSFPLELTVG